MRFLIVASVLAYATAAPSGLYGLPHAGLPLAGHGLAYAAAPAVVAPAHGYAHGVAVAAPTISPGDIQGAAIDAHVEAADHVRASVDATREYHDQAAELHGRAINAAEDHSWQAVDAAKTQEAILDGAAAGAAPQLAKQVVGKSAIVAAAPYAVAHAAPYAAAPYAVAHAPAPYAHAGYASHGALAYGAGHVVAAPHAAYGLGW